MNTLTSETGGQQIAFPLRSQFSLANLTKPQTRGFPWADKAPPSPDVGPSSREGLRGGQLAPAQRVGSRPPPPPPQAPGYLFYTLSGSRRLSHPQGQPRLLRGPWDYATSPCWPPTSGSSLGKVVECQPTCRRLLGLLTPCWKWCLAQNLYIHLSDRHPGFTHRDYEVNPDLLRLNLRPQGKVQASHNWCYSLKGFKSVLQTEIQLLPNQPIKYKQSSQLELL